jgi:hypothetical protein
MYKTKTRITLAMQVYYEPIQLNRPNKTLLTIGVYCVTLHILLLLIMFFYSKFLFISYNMLYYAWYNGSITVLFLIEHTVWLHMLWTLARPPYISLIITYTAVLLLTIAWVMEVVIPVEPDPFDHHGHFCIVFVVGCTINIIGSMWVFPGKQQGVDTTYKYIISTLTAIAVLASAIWYMTRSINKIFGEVQDPIVSVHEPTLEIISYCTYLAGLGVGMDFWAQQV